MQAISPPLMIHTAIQYRDNISAAFGIEYVSGAVHDHFHERIWRIREGRCSQSHTSLSGDINKPSSEKERKEGMRKESFDCEWLTLRHFLENQPSSA